MRIRNFEEMVQQVQQMGTKTRVAVPMAQDEHTLEAIVKARQGGLMDPVLIGDRDAISAILAGLGEEPGGYEIHPADGVDASLATAVSLVKGGEANALMKGKLETGQLLKAVLNRDNGLRRRDRLSIAGLFQCPRYHKLFAVTDMGMNTYPDLEGKKDILINGVDLLHAFGVECPKVAVLAAVEKPNPKMPDAMDGAALKEMNQSGEITGCVVEGPISFDLAMDPEAAPIKGYESPVAGDADLLVVPDIVCGNVLVKTLVTLGGGQTAGIVMGSTVPIIVTSRSAAALDKYYSIALTALVAQNF